jgi:hypothetical protein
MTSSPFRDATTAPAVIVSRDLIGSSCAYIGVRKVHWHDAGNFHLGRKRMLAGAEESRHEYTLPHTWRIRGAKDFRLVVKLDWASARKVVDYARANEMTLHDAIRDAVAGLPGS